MKPGWLVLLWLVTLATHNAGGLFEVEAERRAFYVMQGLVSALLSLSLVLILPAIPGEAMRWAVFALAVYGGAEQALVATCGAAWYFWTPDAEPVNRLALCDRGHGWPWLVWVICVVTVAATWAARKGRL